MKRLCKYRWPADVGELQGLLERPVSAAREPVLEIDHALLDEGLPLGHCRLIEKLGVGGMGELWRQLGEVTLETPWSLERAESWWQTNISASSEAAWQEGNNESTIALPDH